MLNNFKSFIRRKINKKIPKVLLTKMQFFRFSSQEQVLMALEGIVSIKDHLLIPDLRLESENEYYASLFLSPTLNNQSSKNTNLHFSHFSLIPLEDTKFNLVFGPSNLVLFSFQFKKENVSPISKIDMEKYFKNQKTSSPNSQVRANPELNPNKEKARTLKVLLVSHNLNIEGAPKVLFEIAKGMINNRAWKPIIASLEDGPLSAKYRELNIPVILIPNNCSESLGSCLCQDTKQANYLSMLEILDKEKPDIVFANTIVSSCAVAAAFLRNIPSVWMIHESSFPSPSQNMQLFCSQAGNLKAFLQASHIVFCSERTREIYEQFNFFQHFSVINNAPEPIYNSLKTGTNERKKAQQVLNLPEDTILMLNIGVVHENKNQMLIVKSIKHLVHHNFKVFLVGSKFPNPYIDQINTFVSSEGLDECVYIIPEKADVTVFYQAADIYILPSFSESYPLTILEAMACGLPILATPVFGVNEQVKFGFNALSFSPNDEVELASHINFLIENPEKRLELAKNSKLLFDSMPSLNTIIQNHLDLIYSTWLHHQQSTSYINGE